VNGHDGQRRMTAARPHTLPGEHRDVNGLMSTSAMIPGLSVPRFLF